MRATGAQRLLGKHSILAAKVVKGSGNLAHQSDVVADGSGNVYRSGRHRLGAGGKAIAVVRKHNASNTTLQAKTFGTPTYADAPGIAKITGCEILVR